MNFSIRHVCLNSEVVDNVAQVKVVIGFFNNKGNMKVLLLKKYEKCTRRKLGLHHETVLVEILLFLNNSLKVRNRFC